MLGRLHRHLAPWIQLMLVVYPNVVIPFGDDDDDDDDDNVPLVRHTNSGVTVQSCHPILLDTFDLYISISIV